MQILGDFHLRKEEQKCQICSQVCQTKRSLKRHMLIHTGEKRNFPSNAFLTQVDNWFLTENSFVFVVLAYKCQYCDRSYRQSNDLNKHLRIHLGENTRQCTICPQTFKYYAELRKHLEEHYKRGEIPS